MFDFYEKIISVVACVVFVAAMIAFAYYINIVQCYKKYEDYSPEYSYWGGCRIEINGKLTPVEAVRSTDL